MEKDLHQQNLEIQLFSFPTLNPAISSAVQSIKSFSPGEVFEFLQNRFPIQTIKSKAHAKTANALISTLHQLLDSADLERGEITQIKLYEKLLQSFIDEFETAQDEGAETSIQVAPVVKKNKFAEELIQRLKSTAEAERKKIFGAISKSAELDDEEIVEAKFRKVKKR
jgi:hypothetical protein